MPRCVIASAGRRPQVRVASATSAARGRSRAPVSLTHLLQRLDSQRLLRWLLAIALVSLAAIPSLDSDLFWHLATGRWIGQHGLPARDIFSFTAAGHAWVVHEWLADVGALGLYTLGGYPALILTGALSVAAGFGFVFALQRAAGASHDVAVILTVVAALAASTTWGARPQVLNFLLMAALVWMLFRYRAGRGSAWYLPPLFLLWANLHSAYLAGLGAAVLFAAAETVQHRRGRIREASLPGGAPQRLRTLWIAIALSGVVSLLNPGTYHTLLFPLGTLSSSLIQQNIQEWASPDFHSLAGMMLALLLLVLLAGGLTGRLRADLTESVLALGFLGLALMSSRHVPLFMAAGAPLLAKAATARERSLGRSWLSPQAGLPGARGMARPVAHLLVLALAGALMIGVRLLPNLSTAQTQTLLAAVQPVGAAAYLQAHPARNLFNYYDFGGYLIWTLQPQGARVFIDGRVEVYGERVFADYLAVNNLQPGWAEVLARYPIDAVVMPARHPVVGLLGASGWRIVYQDATAAVLER
jgi:hypothetical protein